MIKKMGMEDSATLTAHNTMDSGKKISGKDKELTSIPMVTNMRDLGITIFKMVTVHTLIQMVMFTVVSGLTADPKETVTIYILVERLSIKANGNKVKNKGSDN